MNDTTKTQGLPMTTWLLIFCIFNLLVTLVLFGISTRESFGYFGRGTMMGGYGANMMYGGNVRGNGIQPNRAINYRTQQVQTQPAATADTVPEATK